MKYKIRINGMRYGEVIVESESSETAQNDADMNKINWTGHETTDAAAEPCYQPGSVHTVVEVCPHCGSEIEMCWDVSTRGFKAYCPVCGKRLMLCGECTHSGKGDCDYDSGLDYCRFCPPDSKTPPGCYKWSTGIMRTIRMRMKAADVQRKIQI